MPTPLDAQGRTLVKICGVTRPEDAAVVAEAGADALGLNFYPGSPRCIDSTVAAGIARDLAGSICRVGLFVDPTQADVEVVLETAGLDLLQFHGNEDDAFCRSFGMPYMKAHRVRGPLPPEELSERYPAACAHLLDAYVPGQHGGTGQTFDWEHFPVGSDLQLVLAGGLDPDNVAAAVARLEPWAVDVAAGVEGADKGIKDPGRIRAFMEAVGEADARRQQT
ncbi:MAG: phosphoribosylanthranilate isomerase [Pseudomonadota bacterium]